MRVENTWPHPALGKELDALLARMRAARPSIDVHCALKLSKIGGYMRAHARDTAVVAVSGGIDSALALALAARLRDRGEIRDVVALTLPVFSPAATNQEDAAARAHAVAEAFGVVCHEVALEPALEALAAGLESRIPVADDWARGQLASYIRTPAIYYATSLLTARGARPVVLGTTNRDEGAYIGYFGKATDGMVDVQILSDLPKSRVRAMASLLGVPDRVLDVAPSGDMYDGRLDEQVFGAPYDFVELDTEMRLRGDVPLADLSAQARRVFDDFRANLENMHRYNAHKYLGASPAVHLDVVPARFEGGWVYRVWDETRGAAALPTFGDHRRW